MPSAQKGFCWLNLDQAFNVHAPFLMNKCHALCADSMVDAIKLEFPFVKPIFILIDVHYVHFMHVAPTCEFFATE